MIATTQAATLAVDWGGDYVSASAPFLGTNTNRGGFTSGNPNDITPTANGYNGTNETIYGHLTSDVNFSGSAADMTGVVNDATVANLDRLNIKTTSGTAGVRALLLWKQADFLNGLNTGNVGFASSDTFAINMTTLAAFNPASVVLRTSGGYFIANSTFATGTGLKTLTPTSLTWYDYDPATSLVPDFTGASTNLLTSGQIEGVLEIGFYTNTVSTSSNRFALDSLEVNMTAIPEPSTPILVGSGLMSLWFLRRQKRSR